MSYPTKMKLGRRVNTNVLRFNIAEQKRKEDAASDAQIAENRQKKAQGAQVAASAGA